MTYSRKATIMIKHRLNEDEYNELFENGTLTYEMIRGIRMVKILKPIKKKQKVKQKSKRRL